MGRLQDLTGQTFGELTVLKRDDTRKGRSAYWLCKCSCGKEKSVEARKLLSGETKSCGHLRRQSGIEHQDNFNGMRDRQNKYGTNLEVIRNQKMQPNNTSGVKGVDYHKSRDEWRARVHVGGKEITKWFKDKDDAIEWRENAVEKYYKPQIDKAIENGDLKEELFTKEKIQQIKDEFGTTNRWIETGWLLKDGTQLDLSGRNFGSRSNKRTIDHREIFDDTDDMIEFMGDGNIRIIPEIPALNLQVEPTREQYKKIKTYIESVGNRDNYFLVEFDNKNGDTVADREYENDIDSEKVVEDIRFYFKNGELPYKSELQQFRENIEESNIAKRLNSYIQDDNLIIVDAELDGDTIHCRVLDYSYDDVGESDIVDYYKSDFDIKDWKYIISGKNIQEDVEESKTINDDNIKEYINKYILSLSNNEIINNAKLKERTTFKEGPLFIIPNGNLIDSSEYAIDEGFDEDETVHSIVALYICDEIFDNLGFDRDYMLYTMDGFLEDLTNKYGWIRVNSGTGSVDGRCYIVIPENKRPSEEQFNTLEEWFDFLQNTVGQFDIRVMVKNKDIAYDFDEYTSKDIINKIKRYYSSGNLYEDLSKEEMSNEYDNEGNQLTKAQAEFFRNSKVRDEQGRLLVCYHGSKENINTFDKQYISSWNLYGKGFYFTTDINRAKRYAKKSLLTTYINLVNPFTETEENINKLIKEANIDTDELNAFIENENLMGGKFFGICYYLDDMGVDVSVYLKNLRYDGIITSRDIVAFEPNQIKSITNKEPTNSNNINEKLLKKTIAYHGSQQDNLEIEDRPLYLTNNKEIAIDFAEGYNFGYRIREEEKPTVYTIEIDEGNYKEITTDEEYEGIMDIVNIEKAKKIYANYDGIIYEDKNGLIYYLVFEPNKKCRIIEKEIINEKLQERLEGIKPEMWVTNNPYDIKRIIENKPKQYRILYDKNLDLYAICDSERYIHYDMIERLDKMGYLYEMQDFIEEIGTLENYIEFGQDGGWLDDNWVEPYLIYMVFTNKDDFALGDDDYDKEYKYPFGTIFTRQSDLEDCELYKILEKTK